MQIQRLECNLRELKFASNEPDADTGVMSFTGYGAVFGNVDSYGDAIQKGAFKETLKEIKKSGVWPALISTGFNSSPLGA